jgi:hypothetical protein
MFGKPLMADESEIRLCTASAEPRRPFREGGDDANAGDEPAKVHRHAPPLFFFLTIREYWILSGAHVRNGTPDRAPWLGVLAAIGGVGGEFGEPLECILAQRSRFGRNARFALVLDVGDATIDRVNQFPKMAFQAALREVGVREVDHR